MPYHLLNAMNIYPTCFTALVKPLLFFIGIIAFVIVSPTLHGKDQQPMKTLFEYDAINITIGLPFIRVSPDHGPNESMLGKNKSNYLSLLNSIKFLDF